MTPLSEIVLNKEYYPKPISADYCCSIINKGKQIKKCWF